MYQWHGLYQYIPAFCQPWEDPCTIGDDLRNLLKNVGDVSKDVAALKEETRELKEVLARIDAKLSSGIPAPGRESSPDRVNTSAKPFVTITDDLEEKHELFLAKHTLNQLIGASVEREAVRILLLHFYDVKALKGFTLSGNTRNILSTNTTAAANSISGIQMFPPHFVMLIQAAYFRDSYDEDGKRKRAPPTPENQNKKKGAVKRRKTSDKDQDHTCGILEK
ncbi:unnamed protein product [Allacma fusca]|uniref:Uncharacterized protein n=1 Tax=Allacma fusca TaxID=39272 RepID=A0A8J2J7P7_9HEXA|nr:unnamed protein product [Allacma fusca]